MGDTVSFPLQLPPSFERSWLIQQYFDNFHPAYPFLDQEDFETRVSRTLAQLGCHATDREPPVVVTVDSKASPFLALVCAIWALGQSVSGVSDQVKRNDELADFPPGYSMWSSSRKLLQAFDGLRPPSVDTVRCYVLNCIYALHANMIDVSLQSHAAAARLLILTDSRTCQRRDQQGRSAGETHLWWNIFILDRTLSRMSDVRYMLRLDQLPYEIQRDLEAPWWQEQRCSESSPGVSDLESQLGRNEIAAVDGDVLCLRAMGSLCNMWSVYSDEISKPRRGNCCTLRQTALLDTELQVFADSLPAELQWGGKESPSIPNGAECNSTRQLLIFLVSSGAFDVAPQLRLIDEDEQSTNLLRLLLRRASPTTCNCFVRTKTGDGRGIACKTIRACSKVISPAESGPFAPGIAITVTTALVYSISLFLGILDDEHVDEQESERISGLIEEGYGFLMQLVPSCKFASSAVSSLDERLFSSENDPELGSSKSSDPVAIGLDTLYDDGVAQGAILAGGLSPARDPLAAGASVEMESGNNPLQDLETGYGDLDSISLGIL